MASNDVVIVSAVRTPLGAFRGALSSLTAVEIGTQCAVAALERAGVPPAEVQEVFCGNVLSAGLGQAPAKQVCLNAGLSDSTPCTTVNKVCASGLKAVSLGAQTIALGHADVVLAGGFESMSNVPRYAMSSRGGQAYGDVTLLDGILKDALTDAYDGSHMGMCAEKCARDYSFSREDQDAYAIESYKRALAAQQSNAFADEIVPIKVPQRRGPDVVVDTDEEPARVKFDRVPGLRPVFDKAGTVTAANASSLNDGAAFVVLMSAAKAAALGVKPVARVRGYADAATTPVNFTIAPQIAMPKALARAGLKVSDVDVFEINEAFAVVALANMKLLKLDHANVNVYGGGVSIGHPVGCSGARILATLITALRARNGKIGCAGICNGGGGASALVLEMIE